MFVKRILPLCSLMIIALAPLAAAAESPAATLGKLCDEFWQGYLKANPTYATSLGDHRYDDRLEQNTPEAIVREQKRLESIKRRALAIDPTSVWAADRLNQSALLHEIGDELATISCHDEDWVVDPLGGPQVAFMNLPDQTRLSTTKDARNFVARCRAMAPYLDAHIANLRRGLANDRVSSRDAVRKTIEELAALEAQPIEKWALLRPLETEHPEWPASEREAFRRGLTSAVRDVVKPALSRYRVFLETKVMPAARPPEKAGLSFLPGGAESYTKRIRIETSLDVDAAGLHRLGLQQVDSVRSAMSALGGKLFGTTDLSEIRSRLRSDPKMHFANAQEVETTARDALARARAALPGYFNVLPKADCEVKVMGMHEAPNSTIAYYRPPADDGSRPGYYMLNTYLPETRPRYEAQALAFHEAIPGHHLQTAIARELGGVPEFRTHLGVTAFTEGWGLYAERLADEMGLYSSDLDRMGMLSFDAWRACRLVVDTGLHSMGWSRQRAIDYMVQNTALAENNIENEVDRYLTWPGQALAYKCGEIQILRLRAEARERLGDKFDLKAFHEVVLKNGAITLYDLRYQVQAWIDSQVGEQ
jgi:uncharacterized protein (DUF885 family)